MQAVSTGGTQGRAKRKRTFNNPYTSFPERVVLGAATPWRGEMEGGRSYEDAVSASSFQKEQKGAGVALRLFVFKEEAGVQNVRAISHGKVRFGYPLFWYLKTVKTGLCLFL
ncbi:hypothetical protein [Caldanaerobius fijiensis]|uniref:hypothetical protein n=1 Tax=Caldanaerobius fijiensis TaxID=456330 RepID=UPI0013566BCF|nr:hypothetical protein [Caldanaerobius fijiensis]